MGDNQVQRDTMIVQAAWLPSLLDKQVEVDYIPFQDPDVLYHLGFDFANGHYY